MAQKAEILAAFAQTGTVFDDFLASRDADERADTGGRENDYSAKELVALTGFWMRYMVERMIFYTRGEEPPRDVDFDALNRGELARQASQSWGEVAQADALPKDRPIVTYCNMHHPGQSRGERAAALLAAHGYPAAALAGGYSAWMTRFPAEKGLAE
ncbi:MAG TPA: rhodanese-like domain-containing protein [Ktedonobacterales bacterium]|nr:rhodanese-like domain-containing protein [Ktedonobacterales bacterium]